VKESYTVVEAKREESISDAKLASGGTVSSPVEFDVDVSLEDVDSQGESVSL
jgi:hypothetical protein